MTWDLQWIALAQLIALGGCVVAILSVVLVGLSRPLIERAGAHLPPAAQILVLEGRSRRALGAAVRGTRARARSFGGVPRLAGARSL